MTFMRVEQSGLSSLRDRFARASTRLNSLLEETMRDLGALSVDLLSDAAPRGTSENALAIGTDAPGRLADSFHFEQEATRVDVKCNQPNKLNFVVNGRGPVRPVRKRALYWQGLDHPVKFARATEPNDFISPVVEEVMHEAQNSLLDVLIEVAIMLESV